MKELKNGWECILVPPFFPVEFFGSLFKNGYADDPNLLLTMSRNGLITQSVRPGTGQIQQKRGMPPTLLCNHCLKPLSTTCFLCACDCVFCEECTFSHFETTSNYPSCGTTLDEDGFTELVVADSTSNTSEIRKINLQALFTKRSSPSSLPFADLCSGLMRQIDVVKTSTKFILKQLLMESTNQGRKLAHIMKAFDALKNENTQIKQTNGAQKIKFEQTVADLQRRLQVREGELSVLHKKLQSKDNTIVQFQRLHGKKTDPSSSAGQGNSHRDNLVSYNGHAKQPRQRQGEGQALQGFMHQKEAQQRTSYQSRTTSVLGKRRENASSAVQPGHGFMNMQRNQFGGNCNSHVTPMVAPRPFSGNSTGSSLAPNTPRIRDLSSRTGYAFTSTSVRRPNSGNQNRERINKRRQGTTSSSGDGRPRSFHGTFPSTVFAVNNDANTSSRDPSQYFRT